MDDEPSTETPPPKRPWTLWQWLMPLWVLTPSLLMIAGAAFGARGPTDADTARRAMVTGIFTGPIALGMCLFLGTKLTSYIGKDSFFPTLLIWVFCCGGVVTLNLAIASTGCSKIINAAYRSGWNHHTESPPATTP